MNRKLKELNWFLERLQAEAQNFDREAAHGNADEILTAVIQCLARGTQNKQIAKEIVEAYKAIQKW